MDPLYTYFGHHKCASSWIWAILAQICREAGLVHKIMVDPLTPTGHGPLTDYMADQIPRHDLGRYLEQRGYDFVSFVTADMEMVEALRMPFKGFHVIRDPRDIIVSAYFSHRNSHPTDNLPHLAAHRERLKSVSKEEGLFLEMEFSGQELRDLGDWNYQHPDILELKMEEVTRHPYESFVRIFEFLDLLRWESDFLAKDRVQTFLQGLMNRLSFRAPHWQRLRRPMRPTGDIVLGRVYDNRFEKKAGGRAKGKADAKSHYRKGKAGDWRNHLTPAHIAHFKETYPGLVSTLGYETDESWELETHALEADVGP
ncbi:MAG: sulfotransferase [Bacteroidota bacterium]